MRRFRFDGSAEERRELESVIHRQLVVRDDQDFLTSFDPSDGDTLQAAVDDMVERCEGPSNFGQEEPDLVLWQGGRIRAVVRRAAGGSADVTLFPPA